MSMHKETMTFKEKLRARGIDLEAIGRDHTSCLPPVNRAVFVCKDRNVDTIRVIGIPQTQWCFEGVVEVVEDMIVLIDKDVVAMLSI